MSMTRSSRGREQQVNRFPAAGASSGSGSYFTDPEINPHSQVWQTPVRQDQRTGTSQASASSSRLWNLGSQQTMRPARANEILGPSLGDPAGARADLARWTPIAARFKEFAYDRYLRQAG